MKQGRVPPRPTGVIAMAPNGCLELNPKGERLEAGARLTGWQPFNGVG